MPPKWSSLEELDAEISKAMSVRDPVRLDALLPEIASFDDDWAAGLAAHVRGVIAEFRGDFAQALEHDLEALRLYREAGAERRLANVFNNIGCVRHFTGDLVGAMENFSRAADAKEQRGSSPADELNNVGAVYFQTGSFPQALETFQRVESIADQTGNRALKAAAVMNIANVRRAMGDVERARAGFREVIELEAELGRRQNEALACCNLALTLSSVEQFEEALALSARAERLYAEIGDVAGTHRSQHVRLATLVHSRAFAEARALLDSLDLSAFRGEGRMAIQASAADVAAGEGDLESARAILEKAVIEAGERGYRSTQSGMHQQLRDLARKRGDLEAYIEHDNTYRALEDEIRGRDAAIRIALQERERELEDERREAARQRELLYGALPREIADRMVRGEDVSGDSYPEAAVLFFDIAGFTDHAGRLAPAVVTTLLGEIFTATDDLCARHDVTKIKTIGDCYMAVAFGHEGRERPCAVGAAAVASELSSRRFEWPDGTPVELRFGLHSGPVVAGVIGTQRLQYDVWGDTVNVASRMESSGAPGRIHASDAFVAALREAGADVGQTERGTIDVKSKGPMTTFWLECGRPQR